MSAKRKFFIIIIAAVYGIIFVCVMIALIFGGTFGIKHLRYKEEVRGDFVIRYFDNNDVELSALSKDGKTKSRLRIPATVDGKEITNIGKRSILQIEEVRSMCDLSEMSSNNVKDLILAYGELNPAIFYRYYGWKDLFPNAERIFLLEFQSIENVGQTKVYISSQLYKEKEVGRPANISYYYNYANAESNGYYWIDDCAYGSRIEYIPEDPTRDGYTFGGWYKEAECINKWDFDSDTLPEEKTEISEDGEEEVVYQETKLYAKWM